MGDTGDWSCWEAAVWDEYLLHRRLESPEVLGSQGLRGEAMGAVPRSLSAVPGHLKGGAGWVCPAAVPELCQDRRSDGERVEGVQVGLGCLGG